MEENYKERIEEILEYIQNKANIKAQNIEYREYIKELCRAGEALKTKNMEEIINTHEKLIYEYSCNGSIDNARMITKRLRGLLDD